MNRTELLQTATAIHAASGAAVGDFAPVEVSVREAARLIREVNKRFALGWDGEAALYYDGITTKASKARSCEEAEGK